MATYRDIIKYYNPYWVIAGFSIVANCLLEMIDLLVPYCIGQILNILSHQALDPPMATVIHTTASILRTHTGPIFNLSVLLGVIFIVSVLRSPIQPWVANWFHWAIPLRAKRDRALEVVNKILTLPLAFYDEHNPGRIAGRVARGLMNHTWGYPEIIGQGIPKLARVAGIFVLMSYIEWRIALGFLLSFIGILAFSLRDLGQLIERETLLDQYMENTESRTSEIITNIKTVKAFAAEDQELKRMQTRLNREMDVILYRIHKGYVVLTLRQRTVVQCCVFTILALSLRQTLQGQVSMGNFVTILTISSMAYAELEPLSIVAEFFARRYASMLRFHDFLQEPVGKDGTDRLQQDPSLDGQQDGQRDSPRYRFTGKLEFRNICFGYDCDRPVLNHINLCIEPYQTVALVGRSGSGKSTLVKLLLRYFEADRGQILIDGDDILTLNAIGYRRRLAIVHQEVDVFNGTLLDNLRYGNPRASLKAVQEACAIAQIDQFIEDLPKGYATIVGERGVRLSGGQRQRLGIARALIMDPDVLIFDEATSNLDYESERSIQLAMRSLLGTRTLLIIAHRLSTVREADQIVVLDKGQIVEVGNHESLLHSGGVYQRLHALQAEGHIVN